MLTTQPTVLLVDDAPEVRDPMVLLLEEEGYGVVTQRTAEGALDAIHRARPDIVILDLRLPGMSGRECLARLRTSASTATLPVLLYTAALDEVPALAADLDDGHTAVIAKPFELDVLLGTLQTLLATSRAERGQPASTPS